MTSETVTESVPPRASFMTSAMWFVWLLRSDIKGGAAPSDAEAQREFTCWWLLWARNEYPAVFFWNREHAHIAMELVALESGLLAIAGRPAGGLSGGRQAREGRKGIPRHSAVGYNWCAQRISITSATEMPVPYLPPFDVIKRSVDISTSKGQPVVATSYESFIGIIKLMLSGVPVDEEWYLAQYPDVAKAISEGQVESPRQHFIDNGYFEGRLPFVMSVNEKWYRKEYPDVAKGIQSGNLATAQDHFVRDGYKEGRLPFPT